MNVKTLYKKDEQISLESYLIKHGIEDINEYLLPTGKYLDNCLSYINMREAVQNFKWHYLQEDPCYILSDSGDLDGITSACILYKYMKLLNPKWNIKILLHKNKERGLDDDKLYEQILNEPRPLLILPDSGTNDVERARVLNKKNITLLCFDHHQILTPIDTGTLVSNQVGNIDRNGSGCVVTHKFLQTLDLEFSVKYSSQFIDLVALSIISDSMDITSYQNRTYLYYGLFNPNSLIKNEFLRVLIDKFIGYNTFTIRDIVYKIVPKFNSISRSGNQEYKQRVILALLGMDDYDEVADICEEAHKDQIDYVKKFVNNCVDNVDNSHNIIVLSDNTLRPSYSGLIAGKLTDVFNKPCIVGKEDENTIVGSLRSNIPLANQINETGLAKIIGHEQAAGAFLPIDNVDKLYEYMKNVDIHYQPDIEVLQSYLTSEIPLSLFGEFTGYNIWDTKFLPKPLFHIKNIHINGNDVRILGKNEKTIKFEYKGVSFIKFQATKDLKEQLHIGKNKQLSIEVIGELDKNEFRSKITNQVIIDKIEVKEYNRNINDVF